MPINVRFYFDQYGIRRADIEAPWEMVGWFLEQDAQRVGAATWWLRMIDSVASGQSDRWEGSGNAFTVTLSGGTARLECLWNEDVGRCEIGLEDFRQVVEGWLDFCAQGPLFDEVDPQED